LENSRRMTVNKRQDGETADSELCSPEHQRSARSQRGKKCLFHLIIYKRYRQSVIFIKKILYLCTQKGARLGCASAIGASSIALCLHEPCGRNYQKSVSCQRFAISTESSLRCTCPTTIRRTSTCATMTIVPPSIFRRVE